MYRHWTQDLAEVQERLRPRVRVAGDWSAWWLAAGAILAVFVGWG